MFIARKSYNINEDIARNWSSWNFGELGFSGTKEELSAAMNEAIESESSFDISGFELWADDIHKADIRELYEGYWVLVDSFNASEGLSCIELEADSLEEAIKEAAASDYSGDGESFDADDATLIVSNDDIHIFEI